MSEPIELAPGTEWKNPWTGERVRVLAIEGGKVRAQPVDGGPARDYIDARAFLDIYVSAS